MTQKEKLKQFQEFMKVIIKNTLHENNEILKEEIRDEVGTEIRSLMKSKEEAEEKRFRN